MFTMMVVRNPVDSMMFTMMVVEITHRFTKAMAIQCGLEARAQHRERERHERFVTERGSGEPRGALASVRTALVAGTARRMGRYEV